MEQEVTGEVIRRAILSAVYVSSSAPTGSVSHAL